MHMQMIDFIYGYMTMFILWFGDCSYVFLGNDVGESMAAARNTSPGSHWLGWAPHASTASKVEDRDLALLTAPTLC